MISDYDHAHEVMFKDGFPKKMVEFGLGVGTQFFLDRCEHVTSIEIYTKDGGLAEALPMSSDYWMGHFREQLAQYDNWEIIGVEIGEEMIRAERDIVGKFGTERGSDPRDQSYKREIGAIVNKHVKGKGYEYAFVDAGVHTRGDIVNALFGVVPVISAHDFRDSERVYGYHRIVVPDDYEIIDGEKCGEGIRFWRKRD